MFMFHYFLYFATAFLDPLLWCKAYSDFVACFRFQQHYGRVAFLIFVTDYESAVRFVSKMRS